MFATLAESENMRKLIRKRLDPWQTVGGEILAAEAAGEAEEVEVAEEAEVAGEADEAGEGLADHLGVQGTRKVQGIREVGAGLGGDRMEEGEDEGEAGEAGAEEGTRGAEEAGDGASGVDSRAQLAERLGAEGAPAPATRESASLKAQAEVPATVEGEARAGEGGGEAAGAGGTGDEAGDGAADRGGGEEEGRAHLADRWIGSRGRCVQWHSWHSSALKHLVIPMNTVPPLNPVPPSKPFPFVHLSYPLYHPAPAALNPLAPPLLLSLITPTLSPPPELAEARKKRRRPLFDLEKSDWHPEMSKCALSFFSSSFLLASQAGDNDDCGDEGEDGGDDGELTHGLTRAAALLIHACCSAHSLLVTMMTAKMKGKMVEMARSHTVSRVLQMCVKHGRKEEREAVFSELRPHCRELAVHPYAHHLVNRMMDHASKEKKHDIVGQLRGHVVEMMRHPVASAVIEHAYQLSPPPQRSALASEFFAPDFRLFPSLALPGAGRLSDLLANLPSGTSRQSVLQHLETSLQPILEKGIVDHSLFHRVLADYLGVISK
ncbi:unnamed protein product, partial [Closterium sp. NIES-65]